MQLTTTPDVGARPFHFVPAGFDPSDLDALNALADSLLARPVSDADELRQYVYDWGEVSARVWAVSARRMTAMSRDTSKDEYRDAYVSYAKEVMPTWSKRNDALTRKYLASPHRAALDGRFAVMDRELQAEADMFREENTELAAECTGHRARFQEIQGGMDVEWDGEPLTIQQCAAKLAEPDRAVRERAYRAITAARTKHTETIDGIYDELVSLRQRMAKNAGFNSYVGFRFAELHRFDYTAADCDAFHRAVEEVVVPELSRLHEERRRRLALDSLRPWDMQVSPFGDDPEELFRDQAEFIELVNGVFGGVDPVFREKFDILVRNDLLDLMSRPHKAPGGYNCPIEDIGLPFIFYNAVGRRQDIRVLLHEGGHAFHTLATRDEPVQRYRHAPTEFCEVASMAMELFGIERLDGVLDGKEKRDFTYDQFSGCLSIFPRVCRIDAFQIWAYRNPGHTSADRNAKWNELTDRFFPHIDWSGIEDVREFAWQVTPHLFTHPMYYIEYALAQVGALQLWQREQSDHDGAVRGYQEALALGGSKPLPELFAAAGGRFAMDAEVLREVVPPVVERLGALLN
ncbi:MAG: M3 family oligoendopeptidase [Planctomycetota bacterium]|nr:M3 family oligoendopeptidase [Planctomycetota bacterium]